MNIVSKRYIPLIDEIKNHVFQWTLDSEWAKLPKSVNVALTQVMNELKIHEALKAAGAVDERECEDINKDKKAFIAIFQKKYVELCDMKYHDKLGPIELNNIVNTIKEMKSEGSNYVEFIEWFFDDWLTIEDNKKFIPPSIAFICKRFIRDKFLYQMKDTLKLRKKDMDNQAVKNMLLEIALPMAERTKSKEFTQKIVDFSNQVITASKFFEIMKNFADKLNDTPAMVACQRIDEERKMKQGV